MDGSAHLAQSHQKPGFACGARDGVNHCPPDSPHRNARAKDNGHLMSALLQMLHQLAVVQKPARDLVETPIDDQCNMHGARTSLAGCGKMKRLEHTLKLL